VPFNEYLSNDGSVFNPIKHIRGLIASLDPATVTRQQVMEFVTELAGPLGPEGVGKQ
jgi:uncharacterized protein (UPF0297 family)